MSWRAVVVVALSVLSLAIVVPTIFARFPTAYTGARMTGTSVTSVDADSPAGRAGLRPGDSIGCIDSRDYAILSTPFHQQLAAYESDPIRLCITTAVPARHLAFSAERGPASPQFYGNTTMEALRLFSYIVFLFVGCALVIVRPSVMTGLLFGYCFCVVPVGSAYQALTVWPAPAYAAMMAIFGPTSALSAVFLVLFALLVPEERVPRDWRGWLFWAAGIGSLAVIVFGAIYRMFAFGFLPALDPTHRLLSNVMTLGAVVVIVARLAKMDSPTRARFWWVAAAIVIGIITNELRQGTEAFWPGVFGTLTIIMPLTLMYAIVRRHVIDIRFVISKAVVYGALMTVIFGVIAAADWAATRFLAELRVALALDAVIAIGIGIMMHRLTPILEGWVDSVIYRKKHAAEIYLRRLARTLPRAERKETIDRALVEDSYGELDLTMAALFRRHANAFTIALLAGLERATLAIDGDDDIVRFLITERSCVHLSTLNDRIAATFVGLGAPAIAIPIFNGDELVSFVLYGVHRDGTRLDPEEVALLETLAESAGQAYVRVENCRLRVLVESAIQPSAS